MRRAKHRQQDILGLKIKRLRLRAGDILVIQCQDSSVPDIAELARNLDLSQAKVLVAPLAFKFEAMSKADMEKLKEVLLANPPHGQLSNLR